VSLDDLLMQKELRQPKTRFIVIGSSVVTAIIFAWALEKPPQHAFDDAYITYRYAENFSRGLGLLYNPGEWVLGTTTPLFALVLGVTGKLFGDIEQVGHWLGAFAWAVAAWAAIALFLQANRPWAALVAGLLIATQHSMAYSLGMETPLVVALMLGSAWAWLGGRRLLAVLLLGLLFLTRLDGVLWALLLGVEVWRRRRRPPWPEAAATGLIVLPWFAYAQWRYGFALPNSILAKVGQTEAMSVSGHASFLHSFWTAAVDGLVAPAVILSLLSLLLALVLIGYRLHDFLWLPAWTTLYLGIYAALGVVAFSWYFTPPLTLLALLVALGIGALLGDGKQDWFRSQSNSRIALRNEIQGSRRSKGWFVLPALGLISLLIVSAGRWQQVQNSGSMRAPAYVADYRSVGLWLAQHSSPEARVATIEIGVIGYLSQRPILDTMGLVSPAMTGHQVGWTETLTYAMTSQWPDYAVTLQDTAWDWLLDQWWFAESYAPVAQFGRVAIYKRMHLPEFSFALPLFVDYSSGITVTGLEVSEQRLQPGEDLDVRIHVEVAKPQAADYLFTLYLVDAATHERTAVTRVEPFNGGYRSRQWQPGDHLALPARVQVPATTMPGTYRLGLLIYDPVSAAGLPVAGWPEDAYPELQAGWLRIGQMPEKQGFADLSQHPLQVRWGEGIRLATVALPEEALVPGALLPVGLVWHADQAPSRNLTVFVHLIDTGALLVAQQDAQPYHGRWPTVAWLPGDQLQDLVYILIPPDLSDGAYTLRIGLYDEDGRLHLEASSNDYVLLADVVRVATR
jgi:hypothetical protein